MRGSYAIRIFPSNFNFNLVRREREREICYNEKFCLVNEVDNKKFIISFLISNYLLYFIDFKQFAVLSHQLDDLWKINNFKSLPHNPHPVIHKYHSTFHQAHFSYFKSITLTTSFLHLLHRSRQQRRWKRSAAKLCV